MKRIGLILLTVLALAALPLLSASADAAADYRPVLEAWRDALKNGESDLVGEVLPGLKEKGQLLNAGEIGFAFADLDGDKAEELLIGSLTDEGDDALVLYEIYTMRDGTVTGVVSGTLNDRWYYWADGSLVREYTAENGDKSIEHIYFAAGCQDYEMAEGVACIDGKFYVIPRTHEDYVTAPFAAGWFAEAHGVDFTDPARIETYKEGTSGDYSGKQFTFSMFKQKPPYTSLARFE